MVLSPLALRVEHSVGKAQYLALTSIVRTLVGVRSEAISPEGIRVPFFFRPSRGKAPPVVFVHGFGGDKEGWLLMASCLRRSHGLVIPDLPGFGEAGTIPKERASAKHQAAVLARLLDKVEAKAAHIVGNSMGGGIALRFAADFPARAASLTLIGSVGPVVEKSEVGLAFDRGENPLLVESPDDMERLLKLVAERTPPAPRALRRYLAQNRFSRREAEASLFDGWVFATDGDGVPKELSAITTPALILHGAKDRVIHPATARALAAALPNATLRILEGIGHVPQLEAPKRTAESVEAFVDQVSS